MLAEHPPQSGECRGEPRIERERASGLGARLVDVARLKVSARRLNKKEPDQGRLCARRMGRGFLFSRDALAKRPPAYTLPLSWRCDHEASVNRPRAAGDHRRGLRGLRVLLRNRWKAGKCG